MLYSYKRPLRFWFRVQYSIKPIICKSNSRRKPFSGSESAPAASQDSKKPRKKPTERKRNAFCRGRQKTFLFCVRAPESVPNHIKPPKSLPEQRSTSRSLHPFRQQARCSDIFRFAGRAQYIVTGRSAQTGAVPVGRQGRCRRRTKPPRRPAARTAGPTAPRRERSEKRARGKSGALPLRSRAAA